MVRKVNNSLKYLKGNYRENRDKLFFVAVQNRTRSKGLQMQ